MNIKDAVGSGRTTTDVMAAYNYFIVAAVALIVANAWNSAFQGLISPHGVWPAFVYAVVATAVAVAIVVALKSLIRKEVHRLDSRRH